MTIQLQSFTSHHKKLSGNEFEGVSSLSVTAWNHITATVAMVNWHHKLADTKLYEYWSFSRFSWGNFNPCYRFSSDNAKL